MAKDTKMKSIEEKAKRNAVKAIEYACGRRVGEPEYITNLFIQMATEQKAIDEDHLREVKKMVIDKACEWLMKQYAEDDMDMVSASAFINDFRKAMEE